MAGVSLDLVATLICAGADCHQPWSTSKKTKRRLTSFFQQKASIEVDVGAPLDWNEWMTKATCLIKLEKRGVSIFNRDDWLAMNEFLIDAAIRMGLRIQRASPATPQGADLGCSAQSHTAPTGMSWLVRKRTCSQ